MRFCGGFRGIQNLASTENRSEADALAAERLRSALLAIDHTDRRADDQTGLSEGGDGLDESAPGRDDVLHKAHDVALVVGPFDTDRRPVLLRGFPDDHERETRGEREIGRASCRERV